MDKKNDFKRDGTLSTRLNFQGIVKPQEVISKVTKKFTVKGLEENNYWILLDEYGARFMVFDEEIATGVELNVPVEARGKVSISKGGTYLVIESLTRFIPETYKPTEKRPPNWQDEGSVFDMVRH